MRAPILQSIGIVPVLELARNRILTRFRAPGMAIASDITHSEYTQVDDMRIPILLAVAVLTVSACDDQGPFERAGEEVDEAFENARAGGETLGNRLDDAADDVRRSTEDALERAREGVEDAADELENR